VKERDDGIVVSGAKMLATGSALTHATFVAQNSAVTLDKDKAKDFAIVFIAPMDSPGAKLICRPSYEMNARSPFDHPLSSRFDENDAVIIFDNVFVPWENVLVYRDPERANSFYAESRFVNRFTLQAGARLTVKLEMMAGLFAKAIATNGTDSFRGVQAALGEILAWRHLMMAMTTAMCLDPEPAPGGTVVPKSEYASSIKMFASECWPAVRHIFEKQLAGSLLVAPSSFQDLKNAELRPLIDKYYRGSSGSAEERVKLFKLIAGHAIPRLDGVSAGWAVMACLPHAPSMVDELSDCRTGEENPSVDRPRPILPEHVLRRRDHGLPLSTAPQWEPTAAVPLRSSA